ncbi:MAG TPA: FAD-binding protein [Streptosporangiaceae bacterium]|nr:FAD-binding protein [Streptosporangiaceae bacterium]
MKPVTAAVGKTRAARGEVAAGAGVLVEALSRGLPGDRIVTDPDVLGALSHDEAEWAPAGTAGAAVRARSEAEVQHVVRTCAELGAAIVARGAGTGLSGGANAVAGGVILDLSPMNRVLEIDRDNLLAVVQPGAVNDDVKAAVAEHGLWYPPDQASAPWSTIGGNVATNAGGLCCLKYGVTRDYVLGLRAVVGGPVAYGEAVRLGRRTTKGVAGLDLVGLFVGSEGTLGVVTEVTLRLRPALAGTPRTVVAAFGDLVSAGRAVAQITRRGLTPAVLELLDRACLEAVEQWKHLGAHAGDGNLHPLIITPAGDTAARAAAQAAFDELLGAAIAAGGTVTGEHGVGLLKRDGMRRELDPGALAMQDAVRRALDPRGVFNPGKG